MTFTQPDAAPCSHGPRVEDSELEFLERSRLLKGKPFERMGRKAIGLSAVYYGIGLQGCRAKKLTTVDSCCEHRTAWKELPTCSLLST